MSGAAPPCLEDLFCDYRAEWRVDLFGTLFIRPPYFDKLESFVPCFLFGGRGTGKTVSLRSLRFDATSARLGGTECLPYLGIYVRVNKNRVRAFDGSSRDANSWQKAFAHYFNLLVALEFGRLYEWLIAHERWPEPDAAAMRRVSISCCLGDHGSMASFVESVRDALVRLEAFVNNCAVPEGPPFSMPESPVRAMVDLLAASGHLRDRFVFCCIDEYESLLDYQQAIINTYIKHSEVPLTYKVGARRGGLRNRQTIDRHDLLVTPDDYAEIDVSTEQFADFAREVVSRRLSRARDLGIEVSPEIDDLLPSLSRREESDLLGGEAVARGVLESLAECGDPAAISWANVQPREDLIVLQYRCEAEKRPVVELARDALSHPERWSDLVNNYGHSALFWLSKGRRGIRVRKYYCGTATFLALASGNIRYFLELIDASLLESAASGTARREQAVSPLEQTMAARSVARRRLDQLDGLGERGFELKRLVLGIGKVLFELARDPVGRTPEVTSFVLSGSSSERGRLEAILREGVAQLAFERWPRTKATSDLEVRDDEYRLHPIFCPFFEYSHRRKRRVTFKAEVLLRLIEPSETEPPGRVIRQLLGDREAPHSEDLPEQLALFGSFYAAGG